MGQKIKIDLGHGIKLVADADCVDQDFREIYVYLEKNGVIWQDLAVVGEQYYIPAHSNSIEHVNGEYYVKVWANHLSEDITDEFTIKLFDASSV